MQKTDSGGYHGIQHRRDPDYCSADCFNSETSLISLVKKFFFLPGDWLAEELSARSRRALATWVLILCIFPLTPVWVIWFFTSVAFIAAVSIFALILAAWGILSAETPVESEQEVKQRREERQNVRLSGKK